MDIDKPLMEPVLTGGSLMRVALSLALIIVMIYAVAWYVRRMRLVTSGATQAMRVVSALSVGGRERVVLVQVGDEQILLGVAPGRVNLLRQYDKTIVDVKGAGFRSSLSKMLSDKVDNNSVNKNSEPSN